MARRIVDTVLGLAALAGVFCLAALALGSGFSAGGIAAMVLAVAGAAGRLVAAVGASRGNGRPPSRDR
jgi:hypothetical protein